MAYASEWAAHRSFFLQITRLAALTCLSASVVGAQDPNDPAFPTAGTDVIVGDLPDTVQFGREGTIGSGTVGLAVATTSCNKGDTPLNWFRMPNTNHPVIAQNMYRMTTIDGSQRFEQIGQSWLKHGFCALQGSLCFNCTPTGGGCENTLGSGCSDPYSAGLNAVQDGLGARSWVHPFKGAFPSNARNHGGHAHDGISHRLQVRDQDLVTAGATYYAEGHYVAADDAADGNFLNNSSYRRVSVSGPNGAGTYGFGNVGATVRESRAIDAWSAATQVLVQPTLGDGIGILAHAQTHLGGGQWHYEYALYNYNADNSYCSFSVPLPPNVTISNMGAHYVRNHGIQVTGAAFSNDSWTLTEGSGSVTWATVTEATNQNANALRWGTLFNFRFDADTPPQSADITIGLFKSGGSTSVTAIGPSAGAPTCHGDLDGNGEVGLSDLSLLLSNFGTLSGAVASDGDLDGDGDVDLGDLAALLAVFGATCP